MFEYKQAPNHVKNHHQTQGVQFGLVGATALVPRSIWKIKNYRLGEDEEEDVGSLSTIWVYARCFSVYTP